MEAWKVGQLSGWFARVIQAADEGNSRAYSDAKAALERAGILVEVKTRKCRHYARPAMQLVNSREMAEILGRPWAIVMKWYRRGWIPGFRLGPGAVWFQPEEVLESLHRRYGNGYYELEQSEKAQQERRRANGPPKGAPTARGASVKGLRGFQPLSPPVPATDPPASQDGTPADPAPPASSHSPPATSAHTDTSSPDGSSEGPSSPGGSAPG